MVNVPRVIVIALLVALTSIPAAGARAQGELPPGGTFSDDDGSVHEPAIEALVLAGITVGCADGLYCPDDPVTRGQMATFLALALPDLEPATSDWFPDDNTSIHQPNINTIAANGISIGFTDGTYRPALPVTRGQMATFLARGLRLTPIVPPVAMPATVYLFMDTLGDDPLGPGPFLVPVNRLIAETTMPATAAMRQLLAGPTAAEVASVPAISSAIPDGTELLGVAIADGIATVDLSAAYASGGGSASMLGRVAQVVFTLTRYSTVDQVSFELEGAPIDVLGGEGVILDDYNTRVELFDQLPLVFVDQPSYHGQTTSPMRIRGWTAAFEATFNVAVVDADGLILTEQSVTAGGDQVVIPNGPVWTAFEVEVPYAVEAEEVGALITWADSAKDGSPQGVREYPVGLVPAG